MRRPRQPEAPEGALLVEDGLREEVEAAAEALSRDPVFCSMVNKAQNTIASLEETEENYEIAASTREDVINYVKQHLQGSSIPGFIAEEVVARYVPMTQYFRRVRIQRVLHAPSANSPRNPRQTPQARGRGYPVIRTGSRPTPFSSLAALAARTATMGDVAEESHIPYE